MNVSSEHVQRICLTFNRLESVNERAGPGRRRNTRRPVLAHLYLSAGLHIGSDQNLMLPSCRTIFCCSSGHLSPNGDFKNKRFEYVNEKSTGNLQHKRNEDETFVMFERRVLGFKQHKFQRLWGNASFQTLMINNCYIYLSQQHKLGHVCSLCKRH